MSQDRGKCTDINKCMCPGKIIIEEPRWAILNPDAKVRLDPWEVDPGEPLLDDEFRGCPREEVREMPCDTKMPKKSTKKTVKKGKK